MNKTPWAVICRMHGRVYLTNMQYNNQLDRPDSLWMCPICGESASFDDANYEEQSGEDNENS